MKFKFGIHQCSSIRGSEIWVDGKKLFYSCLAELTFPKTTLSSRFEVLIFQISRKKNSGSNQHFELAWSKKVLEVGCCITQLA